MKDNITTDELIRILDSENLTELSYESPDFNFSVKKTLKLDKKSNNQIIKNIIEKEKIETYLEILSNGIGSFYRNPNLSLGIDSNINSGDEIGYILAMGVKSPIISEVSGKIVEILIKDGDIVDYNKTIAKLKK
ncbi:MAG: acetyl-CoA carboxylase biotin carboxyl carrier protein [Fusobacteriaceae bacterium]